MIALFRSPLAAETTAELPMWRAFGIEPTVYIAGPMTGYEDYNYPAFHAAAAIWRAAGWRVHNPAEQFDGDTTLPRAAYMRRDVELLSECHGVVFLKGWQASRGATFEATVARELDLFTFDVEGRPVVLPEWPEPILPVPLDIPGHGL